MPFFYMEPEVAGGLGENSILDRSVHPPLVSRLHYDLDGWLGDVILESFPVFIVTEETKNAILLANMTGCSFDDVEITTTENFREIYPEKELPSFAWLKPGQQAGQDDFSTAQDGRLVISGRALHLLQDLGADNAIVEEFTGR